MPQLISTGSGDLSSTSKTDAFLKNYASYPKTGAMKFPEFEAMGDQRVLVPSGYQTLLTQSNKAFLELAALITVLDAERTWKECSPDKDSFIKTPGSPWLFRYEVGTEIFGDPEWRFDDGQAVSQTPGTVEFTTPDHSKELRIEFDMAESSIYFQMADNSPFVRRGQSVFLTKDTENDEIQTYYDTFLTGLALEDLRIRLGNPHLSLMEIALEAAARIYTSGQYSHSLLGSTIRVMDPNKEDETPISHLHLVNGKWEIQPKDQLILGNLECFCLKPAERQGIGFSIFGDMKGDIGEELNISLEYSSLSYFGDPMPLAASFRKLFWEVPTEVMSSGTN